MRVYQALLLTGLLWVSVQAWAVEVKDVEHAGASQLARISTAVLEQELARRQQQPPVRSGYITCTCGEPPSAQTTPLVQPAPSVSPAVIASPPAATCPEKPVIVKSNPPKENVSAGKSNRSQKFTKPQQPKKPNNKAKAPKASQRR